MTKKSYKKDDMGLCLKIAIGDPHLINFGERLLAHLSIDFTSLESSDASDTNINTRDLGTREGDDNDRDYKDRDKGL